jgi:opacity protein-like surface antigen
MKIGRYLMGVVGSTLIATSAVAADLPPTPTAVAPPPPMAAPAFDWGGMYFGANVSSIGLGVGAHVGFNIDRGRMVLGLEGGVGVIVAGPVLTAYAKGRLGVPVGQRALLYGFTTIETIFAGPAFFVTAGGGGEFAFNERISMFAEAGLLAGIAPPGCCGFAARVGLNIHR